MTPRLRLLATLVLLTVTLAPTAASLAALPVEPNAYSGYGTDVAAFRLRVRVDPDRGLSTLRVDLHPSAPTAEVAIAPGDGAPGTRTPLNATAILPLDASDPAACWRGWCGVFTVYAHIPVPNRDGRHGYSLRVAHDDGAVTARVAVGARAQAVEAEIGEDQVWVRPTGGKPVAGVTWVSENGGGAWDATRLDDATFVVPRDTLPEAATMRPVVRFHDGATLQGAPLVLPPATDAPAAAPPVEAQAEGAAEWPPTAPSPAEAKNALEATAPADPPGGELRDAPVPGVTLGLLATVGVAWGRKRLRAP